MIGWPSRRRAIAWIVVVFATPLRSLASSGGEPFVLPADPRVRVAVNDNWRFLPAEEPAAQDPGFDDAGWTRVNLPHTWNAADPFDDEPGYRRGPSWYRRPLEVPAALRGRRLYLYFEGAHQYARVFVNGHAVGEHKGGYTAFCCEITDHVRFGDEGRNLVAVRVDNSHDDAIPPLDIGFAHYGGIYRDVWLVATQPVHVEMLDHASPGLVVDTPQVTKEAATFRVRGTLVNDGGEPRRARVVAVLIDAEGRTVSTLQTDVVAPGRGRAAFALESAPVARPRLWSPADPYLYRLETLVYDAGDLVDRVTTRVGFRWFAFDPEEGFRLNGERLPLRGASRHQDYAGLGSAVPNAQHRRDLQWLKEMGGNFLRLAHYPQDPAVLDAADELGLLVWEEIPIVSTMNATPAFADTCRTNLREMIRQHRNHPCVIVWGYMNEVFLNFRRSRNPDPKTPEHVRQLARQLEAIVHEEDPTRFSVMAMDATSYYNEHKVADIPQVAGWNIYMGWYGEGLENFGRFLDEQHAKYPHRPLIVSEYGSGSDDRLHSLDPIRFDHTCEYHNRLHESHLRQIEARPYLAGTLIWNLFDFSQPEAGDTIPHMNQKGMLTFDRRPKDVYYMYQARWSDKPVLHICKEWSRRSGTDPKAPPGSGRHPVPHPVVVYTNLEEVELLHEGRSLGIRRPEPIAGATWQVPLHDGWNEITARGVREGRQYHDVARIHFTYRPSVLADPSVPFEEIAVNAGSTAQYLEPLGPIWEPDQPYVKGGWGYLGGRAPFAQTPGSRARADILGTPDDAIYQVWREGVEAYRFDVPDGDYELDLRFTEYTEKTPGTRVFRVTFNGRPLIDRLDLAGEGGYRRAVAKVFQVRASGGQGATVGFEPIVGQTVVSAIRIRRLP